MGPKVDPGQVHAGCHQQLSPILNLANRTITPQGGVADVSNLTAGRPGPRPEVLAGAFLWTLRTQNCPGPRTGPGQHDRGGSGGVNTGGTRGQAPSRRTTTGRSGP